MKNRKILLSLYIVGAAQLLFSASAIAAAAPSCHEIFSAKYSASDYATLVGPDLKKFNAAQPVVKGGVTDGDIRDQGCAEICWSYGTNELAEMTNFLRTGEIKKTSPDHNGFWHFYFQIVEHASYFNRLAKKVQNGVLDRDAAIHEALLMMKTIRGSRTAARAGFTIDSGSDEPTALNEVAKIGLVPIELFDRPIATLKQANQLTASLKDLVSAILSASPADRTAMLKGTDPVIADGINTPLYNLKTQKLAPVLNASASNNHLPYRPKDVFTASDGQQYTPLTYMTNALQFIPQNFVSVQMTADNQGLISQVVQTSLTAPQPMPVLMGLAIYNQKAFEAVSVLSADLVQGTPVLDGGHLVMIVNMKANSGQSQGFIFQNSWGSSQGFDANGETPSDPTKAGYNGVTNAYNSFTVGQGEPPDFTFPKALLQLPQFRVLQRDASPTNIHH